MIATDDYINLNFATPLLAEQFFFSSLESRQFYIFAVCMFSDDDEL